MGSLKEFSESVARFRQVTFDTSTCIFYFQEDSPHNEAVSQVIRSAVAGKLMIELPGIVQLELMVKPFMTGDPAHMKAVRSFIDRMPGIVSSDVTRDVVLAGAAIRALVGLKAPDALVVASAAVHGSDAIIGSDRRFSRLNGEAPTVLTLAGRALHLPSFIDLDEMGQRSGSTK